MSSIPKTDKLAPRYAQMGTIYSTQPNDINIPFYDIIPHVIINPHVINKNTKSNI